LSIFLNIIRLLCPLLLLIFLFPFYVFLLSLFYHSPFLLLLRLVLLPPSTHSAAHVPDPHSSLTLTFTLSL
jgi:hypothetical protein